MAPWYEIFLACDLKENVAQQVIDVLDFLLAVRSMETEAEAIGKIETIPAPDHYFFLESAWYLLLTDHCYYFPGNIFSELRYDKIANAFQFTARAMVRRRGNLIAAFLDWLAPNSSTNGYVGYTRCDEVKQIDLIFFEDGDVYYTAVEMWRTPPGITRRKITKGIESDDKTDSSLRLT
jgi:hypothetical protein